jgi:transposase
MVMVGTDLHKRTHTLVAADVNGRELAAKTVPATPAGHLDALRWVQQWPDRTWALEDCRNLSRRFEADLLRAGETVKRVPPKLMAGARRSAREYGKSDPIDALAVARAALREPDLPVAVLDGVARDVRLLVDHRDDLVAERTRAQNRLRWHLHQLAPGFDPPAGALDRAVVLERIGRVLADGDDDVERQIARQLLEQVRALTRTVKDLDREITALITPLAPALLALYGCGPLTAAKIVGETAGIERFRSEAAYARHNGTAPIPAWSGNDERHRLNRGGNRQLNVALHRIAITQLRGLQAARDYYDRRRQGGDTRKEALRVLKRHLSNIVYRALTQDAHRNATLPAAA